MPKETRAPRDLRLNDGGSLQMPGITYATVVEKFIDENFSDSKKAAQEFRSNCKAWCIAVGSDLDAPAEEALGSAYPNKVSLYQALLDRTRAGQPKAGKNVRTAAGKLQATYLAMLGSQELPADFNAAFKAAMDTKGYKPADINRLLRERYFREERPDWYGAQLWGFYDGTAGPGKSWKGDSRLMLQRCEELLGLEPNALVSRAYRVAEPIRLGTFNEIPYRIARSKQWSARYALRSLPQKISKIFNAFASWRGELRHRINGEIHPVEDRSLWTRPATTKMARIELQRFCGWLCLPASETPLHELSDEARWLTGKGMKPEELCMRHLFDLDLVWAYVEFLRFRQHNHAFTTGHLHFLHLINAFVSMPYSFLVNHADLAEEFGFDRPNSQAEWIETMEQVHKRVLRLTRAVQHSIEGKQRSPDEPLRHVMSDADPYVLFLQMADRLEQSPPLRANRQTWAVWARDVALIRMELEVPLRIGKIVDLCIDRHVKKDQATGGWRIFVPKSELKNFYSGHAEDIDRLYGAEASKAIDRYISEARDMFVGAEESKVLFLGPAAGRRADAEFAASAGYKLSTDAIDYAIRKHLTTYFGAGQGANIFRHVIATGILKDDPNQVDAAAAALNNSPNTIRLNYKHLTQSDGIRHVNRWFDRQRNKGRQDGGGPHE